MQNKTAFSEPLMLWQESSSLIFIFISYIYTTSIYFRSTIPFLSVRLHEDETTDITMLSGREPWICHRSLLVDLSFSASLFYVRENKLVGHKVLIFFKSGLCAVYGRCSTLHSLMDGCSRGMGTGRWIEMSYISMAAALWIAGAVVGLVSTQGTEWQSEKSPLLPAAQTMLKDNRGPRAGMRWSTARSFSLCNCIKWFHHSLIIYILSLYMLLFWTRILALWCNAFMC